MAIPLGKTVVDDVGGIRTRAKMARPCAASVWRGMAVSKLPSRLMFRLGFPWEYDDFMK
jgi:hypothetical protein